MVGMALMLLGMAALGSVMGSVGADARPVTGSLDGPTMSLTIDGARCRGDLDRMDKDGGLASIFCTDGRKGSVNWSIVDPKDAAADGYIAGETLTLHLHLD